MCSLSILITNLGLMVFIQEKIYLAKKEMHWISLFIDRDIIVYFDSFGIEYIP